MNYLKNLVGSHRFRNEQEGEEKEWGTDGSANIQPSHLLSDKRINIERISQRLDDLSESRVKVHVDSLKSQDSQSFYTNLFIDMNAASQTIVAEQLNQLRIAQENLLEERKKTMSERDRYGEALEALDEKDKQLSSILEYLSPSFNEKYYK
jgi:hypothetical protein